MSALSPTTRRWMSPPPIYESAHAAREGTTLTPYLTLPYILSLTWLAYPIISLLFVAFRLQISSASAQDAVSDAKGDLLTSCAAAEKAATVAASMPRYMAAGANKQIADAANGTMNAARATLVLALTILEAVINFAIDIYRSTFFCFLELVVRGGLSVLIGAVQEINSFLQSTFSTIRTSIQSDISSVNSAIQSAVDTVNKVNPFNNISAPQFSVPSLDSLSNVTLPTDFQDALTKLNASLPTLDQVRNAIEDIVDTPFEDLKADINNTFAGLNFNESALPVPKQQTLSFCGDLDTSVVDDLGHDLLKATKIGIIILVVLALLLLGAHCALEWYKWRCLQQHLMYTRQAWITDPTMNNSVGSGETPSLRMTDHNLLVLAGSQQHPLLTRISNQLAALLRLSHPQHTKLQWFFHYVFHPPALACFLIGFLGLLSVELQLISIGPLESKYSQQVASSVSGFSNTIATSINANMYNQSASYADQINSQINTTQSAINDGLFGWVNGTTTTLNDTLVTFYSDIQNAVTTVFNGTVLEDPMQEFVRCIIGTKIEAIENALTFLHNNLIIDIPAVNQSVLVLSQSNVNEVAKPISDAAVGDGSGDSQGVVGKLIARYVDSLKKERLMFIVFIGLWGLVVLIALLIILWHSYAKPVIDARKQRKFRREHRDYPSMVVPYATPAFLPEKVENKKTINDLPSFAPKLTPRQEGFFNVNLRSPTGRQSARNQNVGDEPQLQRSWDSLVDSSANQNSRPSRDSLTQEQAPTKKVSQPRKLMAIGKKAGRERFISDEERARMQAADANGVDDDVKENGWMKRLTSAFVKKDPDEGNNSNADLSDASNGSRSSRPRPKLTISTNATFANVSRDQLPTAGGNVRMLTPHVKNNPPSAWSISPGPPRGVPWLPNPLNTAGKKPKVKNRRNVPGLPTSPRQPRMIAGPSAFTNGRYNPTPALNMPAVPSSAATVTLAAQPPSSALSPSAVPSYNNWNHARRDSLLPENTLTGQRGVRAKIHKRSSSAVPLLMSYVPSVTVPHRDSRLPTELHVRHDSPLVVVDPFRTPFDDDTYAVTEQPSKDGSDLATKTHMPSNPFSPGPF
ncbi:hypothetical protein DFH11DRAFT_1686126 [Phellopilus nigrolimitatus]|nr:hypothetical protein DFH11DRAFT_1686126 [Phellopilus nigrolimitatus]